MRCPVCGAKLMAKQICPFCKVTDSQILNASNRKVKEYRKTGNTDLICYSSVIPSDLSKLKVILYTIFLGFLGVNHYYILRPVRATFSLVSTVGSLGIFFLGFARIPEGIASQIYSVFYVILFFMMAINVVMWLADVLAVILRSFKVPVVLGKKE